MLRSRITISAIDMIRPGFELGSALRTVGGGVDGDLKGVLVDFLDGLRVEDIEGAFEGALEGTLEGARERDLNELSKGSLEG